MSAGRPLIFEAVG